MGTVDRPQSGCRIVHEEPEHLAECMNRHESNHKLFSVAWLEVAAFRPPTGFEYENICEFDLTVDELENRLLA